MSGNKIVKAIDSKGLTIFADSYSFSEVFLPLYCPEKGCGAQVKHVEGFKRESYGKQQFIPSYFRLAPHSEHHDTCLHKTRGLQTLYVSDSHFEVRRALEKGEFIFRIHLMDSEERAIFADTTGSFQQNPPKNTTKREYWLKSKKSTYAKTMESLAEIFKYGEDNPSKRDKIRLIIGGTEVGWSDFFYSHKDLGRLHERLLNHRYAQAAVIVKIKVIRPRVKSFGGFTYIECSPSKLLNNNFCVILKLAKSTSDQLFKLGAIMLVFGRYSLSDKKIAPTEAGVEIITIVSGASQVLDM